MRRNMLESLQGHGMPRQFVISRRSGNVTFCYRLPTTQWQKAELNFGFKITNNCSIMQTFGCSLTMHTTLYTAAGSANVLISQYSVLTSKH